MPYISSSKALEGVSPVCLLLFLLLFVLFDLPTHYIAIYFPLFLSNFIRLIISCFSFFLLSVVGS
jgi:hypothetical protein